MNVVKETGETVRGFFTIMREQPLSLALVVSNFVLLGYIFYSGSTFSGQRSETTKLIVAWQQESDKLMAQCVSKEIMELVLKSLERDRELYRQLLPKIEPPVKPNVFELRWP
jgi:hypothetical protein